jgi:TatA/E family protein of Tat protein translocase
MAPLYQLAFLTNPVEWVVIGIIGLLLFGKRLPEVGRSLGKGITEFKKGLSGIDEDVRHPQPPQQQPYQQQQPPQLPQQPQQAHYPQQPVGQVPYQQPAVQYPQQQPAQHVQQQQPVNPPQPPQA